MSRSLLGRLLVTSAALALCSCGGGDGTYVASIPPPPPAPAPPPPPTPAPPPAPTPTFSPAVFPGITTNTDFATLGLEANNRSYPGNLPINNSSLASDGFSVKFDAASNSYIIGLPSQPAGTFVTPVNPPSPDGWYGSIQGTAFDNVAVLKPSSINLTYTTYGIADGYYTSALGYFAFGSATPASGVPLSGSASYDATAIGATLDPDPSHFPSRTIGGSATLQFDFGAGTLSGHFDPKLSYYSGPGFTNPTTANLGSYNFVNTVYGAGKTSFSGQLSISGTSSLGTFDGQFTGPIAQELMAKWTAPYLIPNTQTWSQMFGIWVGKKH